MGLADKLVAQNAGGYVPSVTQQQHGANPPSGSPHAGYPSPQQPQGGYPSPGMPQQASYTPIQQPQGGYPSPGTPQHQPGSYSTQQQPGAYSPQQQHHQAGYPPQQQQQQTNSMQQQRSIQPAGPQQIDAYKQILQRTIQEKQLQTFFPSTDSRLDQAAGVAAANIDQVCINWRLAKEMGQDLAKLALFDVVLYIDNSGSMVFDEGGKRIEELRLVLNYVVSIVKLFDSDGLTVRFMNDAQKSLDNVKDEDTINRVLAQPGLFHGLTPLGTELRRQVVNEIVANARTKSLPKPVLVITITDGIPAGENDTVLSDSILYATSEVAKTKYGPGAVSFQFAQVGEDKKAQEFLENLDNDSQIGQFIDCTSNYEQESEQMRKTNGSDLTPQLWILKMLLGAIDSSYDTKDEKRARQGVQGNGSAPPQYGAQGSYGQQQGGYQANRPPATQPSYGQAPPQPVYGQQGGYTQAPQQGYNPPYPQSYGQQLTTQQGFSAPGQGGGYPNTYQQQGGSPSEGPPPPYH